MVNYISSWQTMALLRVITDRKGHSTGPCGPSTAENPMDLDLVVSFHTDVLGCRESGSKFQLPQVLPRSAFVVKWVEKYL